MKPIIKSQDHPIALSQGKRANYYTQSSVQTRVNDFWDRKKKSIHTLRMAFYISITWTNKRKLNFRWLPYFRSENLQGENRTMIISDIEKPLIRYLGNMSINIDKYTVCYRVSRSL